MVKFFHSQEYNYNFFFSLKLIDLWKELYIVKSIEKTVLIRFEEFHYYALMAITQAHLQKTNVKNYTRVIIMIIILKKNFFCKSRYRTPVLVSNLLLTLIPINREFESQFVRAFGVIFFLIASKGLEFFLDSNFINISSFFSLSKWK